VRQRRRHGQGAQGARYHLQARYEMPVPRARDDWNRLGALIELKQDQRAADRFTARSWWRVRNDQTV